MTTLNKPIRHFEFYDDHCKDDAPVILMLPGVSCSAAIWREAIPYFLPHYKLLMFNNPGVNGTSMPIILSVEKIMARVKAVLDHLKITKCHVVGHSMGGYTAQRLALTYPEIVDKLVLVSTSYGGPHSQKYAGDIAEEGFIRLFGEERHAFSGNPEKEYELVFSPKFIEADPLKYKIVAHHLADISSDKTTRMRHFACGSLFTSYGEIHTLTKKTLVIHGQDDYLIPPDGGELLAGQIKDSRILRLQECGHMPMYEREDFYPRIRDFIEGYDVGESAPQDTPGKPSSHIDHTMKTYALGFERLMELARKK